MINLIKRYKFSILLIMLTFIIYLADTAKE